MRQRQEEIGDVLVLDRIGQLEHGHDAPVVVVREHAALGRARGARGVDEGERVLGRHGGRARLEVRGVATATALADLVEGDRVGRLARRIDDDDGAQGGQALAHPDDLRHLARVLADDGHRLGVARDPLALLRGVGWVDGDDHGARGGDGEVAVRPFGARVAQQRDALAGSDADVDEAEADLADDVADLGESDIAPIAVDLVTNRDTFGELLGRAEQQVRDRLRTRRLTGGGAGFHHTPP